MNWLAVIWSTPPEAMKSVWGKGALRALICFGPPTEEHGKSLMRSAPAWRAIMTSVGVNAPGMAVRFCQRVNSTSRLSIPGLVTKAAPASTQARAVSTSRTVPAPNDELGSGTGEFRDDFEGAWNGHREFHDGDAGRDHLARHEQSVTGGADANGGEDAESFDARAYFLL